MTEEQRLARKCINCHCIYGCTFGTEVHDCVTCLRNRKCTVICVTGTTGGLCAACLELSRVQRLLRKENT